MDVNSHIRRLIFVGQSQRMRKGDALKFIREKVLAPLIIMYKIQHWCAEFRARQVNIKLKKSFGQPSKIDNNKNARDAQ